MAIGESKILEDFRSNLVVLRYTPKGSIKFDVLGLEI
jgi:hypothetical protein